MFDFDTTDTTMLITRQGDSGNIEVTDLPTDQNYVVYFSVRDTETNKLMGSEAYKSADLASSVIVAVASSITDNYTVENGEDYHDYYWGLKRIGEDGSEDTILLDGTNITDRYTIRVYPKLVEGTTSDETANSGLMFQSVYDAAEGKKQVAFNEDLTTLETTVTGHTNDIAALTATVVALQTSLTALQTQVDNLSTVVTELANPST